MKYLIGTSALLALIAFIPPKTSLASARLTADPYLETHETDTSAPEGFVAFPIPRQAEVFIFAEQAQESRDLVDCDNKVLCPEGQTCKDIYDRGFRVTIYKQRRQILPLNQGHIFPDQEKGVDGLRFRFTFHSFNTTHALSVEQFFPTFTTNCVQVDDTWTREDTIRTDGKKALELSCLKAGITDFTGIYILKNTLVKAARKS